MRVRLYPFEKEPPETAILDRVNLLSCPLPANAYLKLVVSTGPAIVAWSPSPPPISKPPSHVPPDHINWSAPLPACTCPRIFEAASEKMKWSP